jgi:hypothetical protein
MLEFLEKKPDIAVAESEYKRLLGYPRDFIIEGRARELAEWAAHWYVENGSPWVYAVQSDALELANDCLCIQGVSFSSEKLHRQLVDAEAGTVVMAAVSAGPECEEKARALWQEGKPDEYFFLEVYGSAIVEHLITSTGARLCAWAEGLGSAILPHYSPGYPGWDVRDQGLLLKLVEELQRGRESPRISVLHTGMLRPKKSLLAVFGVTTRVDKVIGLRSLNPCETCSFNPCQYRRAPYRHMRSQIEDVRLLQGMQGSSGNESGVLHHDANYTVSARALRKWSNERLHMIFAASGEVEARFLYEGSTCSNLGHRLEYEYLVKLGPVFNGYKILDLSCAPAQGDNGHKQMCEYLQDAEGLIRQMEKEMPLLGRPLDEVLTWVRPINPATCYCDSDSRQHKWGLVLEVLHYALVQHELQNRSEKQESKFVETES